MSPNPSRRPEKRRPKTKMKNDTAQSRFWNKKPPKCPPQSSDGCSFLPPQSDPKTVPASNLLFNHFSNHFCPLLDLISATFDSKIEQNWDNFPTVRVTSPLHEPPRTRQKHDNMSPNPSRRPLKRRTQNKKKSDTAQSRFWSHFRPPMAPPKFGRLLPFTSPKRSKNGSSLERASELLLEPPLLDLNLATLPSKSKQN